MLSKLRNIVFYSCLCFSSVLLAQQEAVDRSALVAWKAGAFVSESAVEHYGMDSCFMVLALSDVIFDRMHGLSYRADCRVPRSELRYVRVLHRTADRRIRLGELVLNKAIAQQVVYIFRQLFDAAYPIERMVLIDEYGADDERSMRANNSSAFNYRRVSGSKKLSAHSMGLAVDINPLYNPYVKPLGNGSLVVRPASARAYVNRSDSFPYKIMDDDLCVRLFKAAGFQWGGNWHSCKDYQHFEKAKR